MEEVTEEPAELGSAPGQERRLQLRGLATLLASAKTHSLEPVVFLPIQHDFRAPGDLQANTAQPTASVSTGF